ncbi:uncharacterized protein LOC115874082 [Sitophilus oryzae]|uniref:Uncharacterized protein LOC115874082 n=1 Tax=Sitophilus oryzae TaxID=7048 RepID=A0A6J2X198_SITOR|nr:uncharacterized protein LOC115874082 [Sitophilus oryzae]
MENSPPDPPAGLEDIPATTQPASVPGSPQEVTAIGQCKLPPFWRTSPELWFFQVESQFQVHHVRSDITKYHLVVATLDHDTISDVSDIIRTPPLVDRYTALKGAILARLTDSPDAQLHKLLTGVELGDKRPSQLLRHMRSLAGTRVSDDVLRDKHWRSFAAVADEAHDMGPSVMATSHRNNNPSTTAPSNIVPVQTEDRIAQELSALRLANNQLTTLTRNAAQGSSEDNPHRGRSSNRQQQQHNRERSATPGPNSNTGHCWYHTKFGTLAVRCRKPCTFEAQPASAQGN